MTTVSPLPWQTPMELIRASKQPVSLPAVYMQLQEAMGDPQSSAQDIADVISTDAALTARLLRLVNSSMFGFPSRIETISRAVAIVGTSQINELALATSILRVFENVSSDVITMESFWRHSVTTGVMARILATHLRETNLERYFVAGLLHDLGSLMILLNAPEAMNTILERLKEKSQSLAAVETQVMGYSHGNVGEALLSMWNLPEFHRQVTRYHHHPEQTKQFAFEASIIHLADFFSHFLTQNDSGIEGLPLAPLSNSAWRLLDIDTKAIPTMLDECTAVSQDTIRHILGT